MCSPSTPVAVPAPTGDCGGVDGDNYLPCNPMTPTPKGRPYTGIRCPRCRNHNSFVIDSRNCEDKQARRRRHRCGECGHRYTTYEIYSTEYDRLQVLQVSVKQVEAAISTLQAIKGSLNGNENR